MSQTELELGPTISGSRPEFNQREARTTQSPSADISAEPRDDKQSRVKFSVRSSKSLSKFAWEIVAGRCRDEGVPVGQNLTQTVRTPMYKAGFKMRALNAFVFDTPAFVVRRSTQRERTPEGTNSAASKNAVA